MIDAEMGESRQIFYVVSLLVEPYRHKPKKTVPKSWVVFNVPYSAVGVWYPDSVHCQDTLHEYSARISNLVMNATRPEQGWNLYQANVEGRFESFLKAELYVMFGETEDDMDTEPSDAVRSINNAVTPYVPSKLIPSHCVPTYAASRQYMLSNAEPSQYVPQCVRSNIQPLEYKYEPSKISPKNEPSNSQSNRSQAPVVAPQRETSSDSAPPKKRKIFTNANQPLERTSTNNDTRINMTTASTSQGYGSAGNKSTASTAQDCGSAGNKSTASTAQDCGSAGNKSTASTAQDCGSGVNNSTASKSPKKGTKKNNAPIIKDNGKTRSSEELPANEIQDLTTWTMKYYQEKNPGKEFKELIPYSNAVTPHVPSNVIPSHCVPAYAALRQYMLSNAEPSQYVPQYVRSNIQPLKYTYEPSKISPQNKPSNRQSNRTQAPVVAPQREPSSDSVPPKKRKIFTNANEPLERTSSNNDTRINMTTASTSQGYGSGGNTSTASTTQDCYSGDRKSIASTAQECGSGANKSIASAAQECGLGANKSSTSTAQDCGSGGNKSTASTAQDCGSGANKSTASTAQECGMGANKSTASKAQECGLGANKSTASTAQDCGSGGNNSTASTAQDYGSAGNKSTASSAQDCGSGGNKSRASKSPKRGTKKNNAPIIKDNGKTRSSDELSANEIQDLTKWTMKYYQEKNPGKEFKELIPYSGVYVHSITVEHLEQKAIGNSKCVKMYNALARKLFLEVFNADALAECHWPDLSTKRATRLELDYHAVRVLIRYVQCLGETKSWTVDAKNIENTLKKLLWSKNNPKQDSGKENADIMKENGSTPSFELPAKYFRDLTIPTLKYHQEKNAGSEFEELLLYSGVYVHKLNWASRQETARNWKELARYLLEEVFSPRALAKCTWPRTYPRDANTQLELNYHAWRVLKCHVEQYRLKQEWTVDSKSIEDYLRARVREMNQRSFLYDDSVLPSSNNKKRTSKTADSKDKILRPRDDTDLRLRLRKVGNSDLWICTSDS